MILLWFVLGFLLALGIARYNESNKLFWTLALSYIIGFAGMVVAQRISNTTENRSKNGVTQTCPTQAPVIAQSSMLYLLGSDNKASFMEHNASDPVSQDYMFAECDTIQALSMVKSSARDQPIEQNTSPPEGVLVEFTNTS